jgi:hypothetical protein
MTAKHPSLGKEAEVFTKITECFDLRKKFPESFDVHIGSIVTALSGKLPYEELPDGLKVQIGRELLDWVRERKGFKQAVKRPSPNDYQEESFRYYYWRRAPNPKQDAATLREAILGMKQDVQTEWTRHFYPGRAPEIPSIMAMNPTLDQHLSTDNQVECNDVIRELAKPPPGLIEPPPPGYNAEKNVVETAPGTASEPVANRSLLRNWTEGGIQYSPPTRFRAVQYPHAGDFHKPGKWKQSPLQLFELHALDRSSHTVQFYATYLSFILGLGVPEECSEIEESCSVDEQTEGDKESKGATIIENRTGEIATGESEPRDPYDLSEEKSNTVKAGYQTAKEQREDPTRFNIVDMRINIHFPVTKTESDNAISSTNGGRWGTADFFIFGERTSFGSNPAGGSPKPPPSHPSKDDRIYRGGFGTTFNSGGSGR